VARRAVSKSAAPAAVTWRDGIHLTGTPLWCDARRRRDVCFVSSAERVGRAGHGQLIGTRETIALLDTGGISGHLAAPLLKRFTLGTQRLELIASGRGPGAAALCVDTGDRTVLYAGGVRCDPVPHAGIIAGDVRRCDTLVVHAVYGERGDEFPKLATVVAQTIAWVQTTLASGKRPILLVDSIIDGLEVATALARHDLRQMDVDKDLLEAVARVGAPVMRTPFRAADPRPVVWLDAGRAKLPKRIRDTPLATALVSGRARGFAGYDAGFVWPSAAGRKALLGWIESTTAREVYVTGPCADAIATALGPRARVIGPPRQMHLF